MICVDSYGWIERLSNGPKASRYNTAIDAAKPEEIVSPVVIVYEVYKKVKQSKGEQNALEAVAVLSQTEIVSVDQTLSLEAADCSIEYGLHFSDALVYATARRFNAELYTSDKDLRGLKGVIFI
ncbi:MAG: hypothetical protein AUF79_09220 [Crenarchaeota archaeon 13_1_20CM_2_51_8]|nr:MAG: hypothetical protein AUF79_09220 [Crenarchaeota archaeon 13_1_20CM_2_51_8]